MFYASSVNKLLMQSHYLMRLSVYLRLLCYILLWPICLIILAYKHRRRLLIFFFGCKLFSSHFLPSLCFFLSFFHAFPCRDLVLSHSFRGSSGKHWKLPHDGFGANSRKRTHFCCFSLKYFC